LGKPLISDATMRTMYAAMQRLRAQKRSAGWASTLPRAERSAILAQPESLYAAIASQLHRRDTIVVDGADPFLQPALEAFFPDAAPLLQVCSAGSSDECAAIAAGIALKQSAGIAPGKTNHPITVVLLRNYPALTGVLRLMEERNLPLLVIAQGEPESRADGNKRAAATKIPILPVDDSDAVAVCRVMQESTLRARSGWGGAVIHATRLLGSADPVAGMEQRLRIRGLLES
jgi:hypothetical protein